MTQKNNIFAIANQKGGVGKTTTAINLSTALAATQKRVILVDLDPQGNASTGLGIEKSQRVKTSYEVLIGDVYLSHALMDTAIPSLKILTANVDLSGAEIEMVGMVSRETRLLEALKSIEGTYDYVLIDCPPSLGLLTLNALVAADAIIVPLQCEFFALEGMSHLIDTVARIRESFNPKLSLAGIVLTMYDKRNRLTDQVELDVRSFFGDKVFQTVIPRNVRVSEAPSHGKPVLIYDMKSTGADAYIRLAAELLKREKKG